MEIRKATKNDIEKIVKNRVVFVSNLGEMTSKEQFEINTLDYINKHIDKDDLIIWLAVENEKIVSIVILCVYEVLPIVTSLNGKAGLLLNVWTDEEFRRKGLATKLLKNVINDARNCGVGKIQLKATEQGKFVYQKLGFKLLSSEMEFII